MKLMDSSHEAYAKMSPASVSLLPGSAKDRAEDGGGEAYRSRRQDSTTGAGKQTKEMERRRRRGGGGGGGGGEGDDKELSNGIHLCGRRGKTLENRLEETTTRGPMMEKKKMGSGGKEKEKEMRGSLLRCRGRSRRGGDPSIKFVLMMLRGRE